ncbi:hypothetical protein OGAPHI_000712 [Ogataea philodendri]|uniref:Glucose-6-phosphate 1-epimerase n=1 Tax=Ogataea philodendri TaxID=1378263 RepID=A0A9P8TAD7_9ASCO|nr:uncharacterized protein OGAPHI_000712 [Ogataea philodendri]KAH3671001.1 hypothetical protein OGAPHI_000712 [Ogataea philodendri]
MSVEVDGDIIRLAHGPATAAVSKLGATLISFAVDGNEHLYVSDAANVATTSERPVRGGMPVVFPAFGKSYLESLKGVQQHGFARNVGWEFVIAEVLDNFTVARFKLTHNTCGTHKAYREWSAFYGRPIEFELSTVFELHPQAVVVKTELCNLNIPQLEFQFLYHTYFRVPSVDDMYITGLQGNKYLDRLAVKYHVDTDPMTKIGEQTDRLYRLQSAQPVDILSGNYNVRLTASPNLQDLVVWNPWQQGAAAIGDMEPKTSYRHFCCVEFGAVDGVRLPLGQKWFVLLVLIRPLVKVGLDEMVLELKFGESWPVLLAERLFVQHEKHVRPGDLVLGPLVVDLFVELKIQLVLLAAGDGLKLQAGGGELDLRLFGIRDVDGEVQEVLVCIGGAGALRPKNWRLVGGIRERTYLLEELLSWKVEKVAGELPNSDRDGLNPLNPVGVWAAGWPWKLKILLPCCGVLLPNTDCPAAGLVSEPPEKPNPPDPDEPEVGAPPCGLPNANPLFEPNENAGAGAAAAAVSLPAVLPPKVNWLAGFEASPNENPDADEDGVEAGAPNAEFVEAPNAGAAAGSAGLEPNENSGLAAPKLNGLVSAGFWSCLGAEPKLNGFVSAGLASFPAAPKLNGLASGSLAGAEDPDANGADLAESLDFGGSTVVDGSDEVGGVSDLVDWPKEKAAAGSAFSSGLAPNVNELDPNPFAGFAASAGLPRELEKVNFGVSVFGSSAGLAPNENMDSCGLDGSAGSAGSAGLFPKENEGAGAATEAAAGSFFGSSGLAPNEKLDLGCAGADENENEGFGVSSDLSPNNFGGSAVLPNENFGASVVLPNANFGASFFSSVGLSTGLVSVSFLSVNVNAGVGLTGADSSGFSTFFSATNFGLAAVSKEEPSPEDANGWLSVLELNLIFSVNGLVSIFFSG